MNKISYKITGTHCKSCEVLLERKLIKLDGVEQVDVDYRTGKAELLCSCDVPMNELERAVSAHGYSIKPWDGEKATHHIRANKKDYKEIGAILVILLGVYLLLKAFNLLPEGLAISENAGFGFIFLVGLVAAFSSCIAVTGGLLIAVTTKYNEAHPNLTGKERFRPHIYFNIGRIVGYTVLGGLVGALGSILSLSAGVMGVVTIVVSLIMVFLGLRLLKLFPWLQRLEPRMPKFLAHKIHTMSERNTKTSPFVLGALTFFLPCGFTQALQLYVLSTGSFSTGALTMLAFSLGTLPALASLGALTSFSKGAFHRYFVKFAGVLVIVLGLSNVSSGLALTGLNSKLPVESSSAKVEKNDSNVTVVNGVQVARMRVKGYDYSPHILTVQKGVPVEWRIDASRARGCAQVITIPKLGITEFLSTEKETVIKFTPEEPGTLPFSCTMGMTTRGAKFIVAEK